MTKKTQKTKPKQTATYNIIKDDCFNWLEKQKEGTFEAVVTDPPYGLVEYDPEQLEKRTNGSGGIWRLPHSYDGCKRSPMPRFTVLGKGHHERILEFHKRLARLLHKVLVPGGHIFLAADTLLMHLIISAYIDSDFELRGVIIRSTSTLRGGDRPKGAHTKYPGVSVSPRNCCEPWVLLRKPCEGRVQDNLKKHKTGGLRRPNRDVPFKNLFVSSMPLAEERKIAAHPSLKPQKFLRQIVWAALPLGKGRILDPFMGSGSTIAAALAVGYSGVGIERNTEYFDMAQMAIPKLSKLAIDAADE